jgi:phospholipid/cholesterol/gamma-HCH transport system permease protein
MFQNIGEILIMFWSTLKDLPEVWNQRRKIFDQLYEIGNASLLMACILSAFIGGVVSLQTGPVLVERGLGGLLGGVVGISICKELAPVMMSVLIAGRIGSAMTAEIGSMQVYQEIDALKTMNISPIRFLVLPRLVAISIALPTLVLFSILVGWFGGAIVASYNHDIEVSMKTFFNSLKNVVELQDVAHGIIKTFVFAVVIGLIACHQGFTTIGGPRGIGRSVTKSVVNSIVIILILDYFLTRLLLYFEK